MDTSSRELSLLTRGLTSVRRVGRSVAPRVLRGLAAAEMADAGSSSRSSGKKKEKKEKKEKEPKEENVVNPPIDHANTEADDVSLWALRIPPGFDASRLNGLEIDPSGVTYGDGFEIREMPVVEAANIVSAFPSAKKNRWMVAKPFVRQLAVIVPPPKAEPSASEVPPPLPPVPPPTARLRLSRPFPDVPTPAVPASESASSSRKRKSRDEHADADAAAAAAEKAQRKAAKKAKAKR